MAATPIFYDQSSLRPSYPIGFFGASLSLGSSVPLTPRWTNIVVNTPQNLSVRDDLCVDLNCSAFSSDDMSIISSVKSSCVVCSGSSVDSLGKQVASFPITYLYQYLDSSGIVHACFSIDGFKFSSDMKLFLFAPPLIGSGTKNYSDGRLFYPAENSFVNYPDMGTHPFGTAIPLSALPFRAYESIYNAFYRDERNNPFILNGQKEYNKYIPLDSGGADNYPYELRFRNWEQDFLTTAVPTPQQGDAPLVGISSTGVMSIADTETGQIYQVMAKTADDADTIIGADVRENLPTSVMRSIVNYASSGISINDFRNVNAMQRWLETNIRRGFKYRDQIKSHFDVDVSYQELDMPEFLGGVSCDVTPSTVSQTSADSELNPLGSYAGQLYGSGGSNNSVSKYFDEHGFVIGIMSVVPVPNYSQLLPKYFLKVEDTLDYYTPEFGHIGLQPILNQEVDPLDCDSNTKGVVFGYQRAWYDYLQSVDEVHGQFRTDLRNFVMNRVFNNIPVLGPSFTVIDPKQLNDVFTVREINGKPVQPILGQIYFNISAKRPIPRYGIPRLE